MATPFDFTKWQSTHAFSQSVDLSPVKTVSAIFDASDAAVANGTAILANDVFQLITVPADTFVFNVRAEVLTVEGGTCTFDVGDDATADGYLDGVDGSALTNTQSFTGDTTEAFGIGKFYDAANTIDLKVMTGTWTNLKVKLVATMIAM